ncbi:unnamed protein product [Ascophyllum nodosum]
MDKTVKTTGTVMEGQIDKTDMDEEVKTAGTKTGGQIDKAGNRPRQHQAESHGSGSSRSEPDIDGREDNKPDSTQPSGPTGNKGSSSSGTECECSSTDKDEVGGDDGGPSMTEEAIANIWEQGPPRNNDGAWAYYYF